MMSDPVVPDGLQLAHTFWGQPDTQVNLAWAVPVAGVELVPVGPTGVAYIEPDPDAPAAYTPRDPRKCRANADTCEGWKIRDSDYCAGHMRLGVNMADWNAEHPPGDPKRVRGTEP